MISFKEILNDKKQKVTESKIRYLKLKPEEKYTLRIIPKSIKVNESPFIERLVYHMQTWFTYSSKEGAAVRSEI